MIRITDSFKYRNTEQIRNRYYLLVSSLSEAFLAILLQTHASVISSIVPINRIQVHWNTSKSIVELVIIAKTTLFYNIVL